MIEYISNTEMLLLVVAIILMVIGTIFCFLAPPIGIFFMLLGLPLVIRHDAIDFSKPLSNIESSISVEDSRVIIDKLPSNYNYKKLDNDKSPDSNKKQVFKYEEDATFNSSYLVTESGKKYKLNEEDTKFLKERGVK
jgi:hypothetical protein